PAVPGRLRDEARLVDGLAAHEDAHDSTRHFTPVIRTPADSGHESLLVDPPRRLGIEQHQIGVGAEPDRSLLRPEAQPPRRTLAEDLHEPGKRKAAADDPLAEQQRQRQLEAGNTRLRLEDVAGTLALGLPGDVVRGHEVDPAGGQETPESL